MKKITILACVLISCFVLTSCENEPIDTAIDASNATTENGNSSNGEEQESTGDYWPRAINNEWNYIGSLNNDFTYRIIDTQTIDDILYYKFEELAQGQSFLRKTGDIYYIRQAAIDYPAIPGYDVSTTPIEIVVLKDSLEEGETWTTDVSYTITYTPNITGFPEIPVTELTTTYEFTMIERDSTRTVNNQDYTDVLKVNLKVYSLGQLVTEQNNYFAKNVGMIESESLTGDGSFVLGTYIIN